MRWLLNTAACTLVARARGCADRRIAALDIALWTLKGKLLSSRLKAPRRRWRTESAFLCIDRRQWRAQRSTRGSCVSSKASQGTSRAVKIPPSTNDRTKTRPGHPATSRSRAVRELVGTVFPLASMPINGIRSAALSRRRGAGRARLLVVRGAGAALPCEGRWAKSSANGHSRLRRRTTLHHCPGWRI